MTSKHLLNAFAFSSGSFDVIKISTGIRPFFRGSKCLAIFGKSRVRIAARQLCLTQDVPFFAVVTTYIASVVNTMSVAGNS